MLECIPKVPRRVLKNHSQKPAQILLKSISCSPQHFSYDLSKFLLLRKPDVNSSWCPSFKKVFRSFKSSSVTHSHLSGMPPLFTDSHNLGNSPSSFQLYVLTHSIIFWSSKIAIWEHWRKAIKRMFQLSTEAEDLMFIQGLVHASSIWGCPVKNVSIHSMDIGQGQWRGQSRNILNYYHGPCSYITEFETRRQLQLACYIIISSCISVNFIRDP